MVRPQSPTLPPSRYHLIGTYVAIDDAIHADGAAPDRQPLRLALASLGVVFPPELDPYQQLNTVAGIWNDDQTDIPRIQLAKAASVLLQQPPRANPARANPAAELDPVLEILVPDSTPMYAKESVLELLRQPAPDVFRNADVHPEVAGFTLPQITPELREIAGEVVARVETSFEAQNPAGHGLDQIAFRVLPQCWPRYNSFFCEMTQINEFNARNPGVIDGNPLSALTSWRAVFHECVGGPPGSQADWFPGTFLLFDWELSNSQLALSYELAQPQRPDALVKIDEGYIQIDQLADRYAVSTVKQLLLSRDRFPDGGQTLAEYGPMFGWLDHALAWFTATDQKSNPRSPTPVFPQRDPLDQVLDDYQTDLVSTLRAADAQRVSAAAKIRSGDYGLDDYLADWTRATQRAVEFGARSVQRQIEFGRGALQVLRTLTGGSQ